MGMSIQDIIKAQQRAAAATRKYKPAPFKKPEIGSGNQTVKDLVKAQQMMASVGHTAPAATPVKAETKSSVAELIEQQRITVARQTAATAGVSPVLTASQKVDIDTIREGYKKFLAKLESELAEQELQITPPSANVAAEEQDSQVSEQIFTPNVPGNMEAVAETQQGASAVNGISVGEEMGGQVTVSVRPKRKRRTRPASQEVSSVESTAE